MVTPASKNSCGVGHGSNSETPIANEGPEKETILVSGDVKPPKTLEKIWDNQIGCPQCQKTPLKIYRPVAPEGYVCLGDISSKEDLTKEKIKTEKEKIRCVPKDCIEEISDGTNFWNNKDIAHNVYDSYEKYTAKTPSQSNMQLTASFWTSGIDNVGSSEEQRNNYGVEFEDNEGYNLFRVSKNLKRPKNIINDPVAKAKAAAYTANKKYNTFGCKKNSATKGCAALKKNKDLANAAVLAAESLPKPTSSVSGSGYLKSYKIKDKCLRIGGDKEPKYPEVDLDKIIEKYSGVLLKDKYKTDEYFGAKPGMAILTNTEVIKDPKKSIYNYNNTPMRIYLFDDNTRRKTGIAKKDSDTYFAATYNPEKNDYSKYLTVDKSGNLQFKDQVSKKNSYHRWVITTSHGSSHTGVQISSETAKDTWSNMFLIAYGPYKEESTSKKFQLKHYYDDDGNSQFKTDLISESSSGPWEYKSYIPTKKPKYIA